ncbi:hypothetical protein MEO43_23975, partial [Dolichospermum sp. ST_sed5]|nr:hypothetical protein [Dolichospermum sp. ST_sed5]
FICGINLETSKSKNIPNALVVQASGPANHTRTGRIPIPRRVGIAHQNPDPVGIAHQNPDPVGIAHQNPDSVGNAHQNPDSVGIAHPTLLKIFQISLMIPICVYQNT